MTQCQSPYVVKLLDAFVSVGLSAHVMELAASSLYQFLRAQGRLEKTQCFVMKQQMFEALAFLDTKNVVHRDVHANNILVFTASPFVAKLADFGHALFQNRECVTFPTALPNPSYPVDIRPPEFWFASDAVWHGESVKYRHGVRADGFAADLWAMGAVIIGVEMDLTSQGIVGHANNDLECVQQLLKFLGVGRNEFMIVQKAMSWSVPTTCSQKLQEVTVKRSWRSAFPWATKVLHLHPARRSRAADVLIDLD